jgi:hypothetical protein
MRVLDGVNTWSLAGFGCESLWQGSTALGFQMGTAQGIYPWVSTLVMGNLMGRRFWVGRGCFFLGGVGEGRRNSRARTAETFSQDDASSKQPWVYVIYYMLNSGGFTAACLQDITTGVLDPRYKTNLLGPMPSRLRSPAPRVRTRAAASSAGGNTSLSLKPAARNSLELISIATGGRDVSTSGVPSWNVSPDASSSTLLSHRLMTRAESLL